MQTRPIFDFTGQDLSPMPHFDVSDQRPGGGFLYVVAFGPLVKIGHTTKPRARLGVHWTSYLGMQGPLRRLWISPPHVDARGNEIRLLAYAKQRSRLHALKREVFTEIGPDELIDEARAFPFQRAAISPTA